VKQYKHKQDDADFNGLAQVVTNGDSCILVQICV